MVGLLWEDGRHGAAIGLEALWNELGKRESFALLCGYRISRWGNVADLDELAPIGAAHSHTVQEGGASRSAAAPGWA